MSLFSHSQIRSRVLRDRAGEIKDPLIYYKERTYMQQRCPLTISIFSADKITFYLFQPRFLFKILALELPCFLMLMFTYEQKRTVVRQQDQYQII